MRDETLGPAFKALADPTRRLLLDRLRHRNGQTLTELCGSLEMARQSATQHLDLLVEANLVIVVRRGRERLHYLNPAPIHEIGERWIAAYDAIDVTGEVLEAVAPTRLVITFEDSDQDRPHGPSVVTFLVEPHDDIVRLTVTHANLPDTDMLNGISRGWPAVLANLKSLLETGDVLPTAPWSMPEGPRG